jgi:hypothetical protein
MEFPFTAQSLKQSNTPIHYRNHALFAFKAFACSQVVSRSNERTLRLFHFQCPAQLTRINLPATKAQGLSHQLVIANNGVAFKQMFLCIPKRFSRAGGLVKNPRRALLRIRVKMVQRVARDLEVFLVHPGGPLWAKKDKGAWTIPKGEYRPNENPLDAARREFEVETSFRPNG